MGHQVLQSELPDIEQPGKVLQSSVILDGFSPLGEKVTVELIDSSAVS